MTHLLIWILMAYGLSNILVYGTIFNTPRNFIKYLGEVAFPFEGVFKFMSDMLSCMMCTSVWVGFFFGIFIYSPVHINLNLNPYISWFFDGMLSSGAVWAINSVIEWFEENRPKNN